MSLMAQNPAPLPAEGKVRFGFNASPSVNVTKVLEGNVKKNGGGLGFAYGIALDFNVTSNLYFSTGLNISSFGTKLKATDTLARYDGSVNYYAAAEEFDYKLQYLQIPISFKGLTNPIGKFNIYFQFGVSPSFLLSNKVKTSSGGSKSFTPNSEKNNALDFNGVNGNDNETSFSDDVNFIRLPLLLGGGVEYKLNKTTALVAGLKWDNAFTDFLDDKNASVRNNQLGLVVGIFF